MKALIIENEYDVDSSIRAFLKDNPSLFESVNEQTFCKHREMMDLARFIHEADAIIIATTWMYKDQVIEYLDFSDKKKEDIRGPFTVDGDPFFQPLTRIFMYRFKESDIACGECYVKQNIDDVKKPISSFLHDNFTDNNGGFGEICDVTKEEVKYLAEGMRAPGGMRLALLFFRPDTIMIQWMKKYANGRVIVDVGCGGGFLLRQLHNINQPVLGIEPYWTGDDSIELNTSLIESGKGIINVLPQRVEDSEKMIKALGKKALFVFARPCHSDFVETALDFMVEGSEALYITLKKNLTQYDDLGDYKAKAKVVKHEGSSVDKEIVLSIKK